ncbi:MAG: DUF1294 domain-containing protein [Anaerohalosphaera sp.]|nr:DUF1294 domain-containing protein [Anaerohalosphaera sp.]
MSINVITLLFYGYDKRRVIANGGRIPEAVLHLLAVLGGCVGAFAGQMIFRHKIRKLKFMLIFAATVIVQVVVVICWTLPDWQ